VKDRGVQKQYLLERDDISLVAVLADLRALTELKDVSLEEPGIEELIRGVYTRAAGAAPTAVGSEA
jgi:ABC-2 type transport system ATP-binding protein